MEGAEVLPRAAIQVHPVVERDRPHRGGDADAAPAGVAERERAQPGGVDPDVSGVDEERGLERAVDRDPQLRPRVQVDVAAADRDLVDREARRVGRRFARVGVELVRDVLRHERVAREAAEGVDPAEEEEAIGVRLRAREELDVVPAAEDPCEREAALGEADVAADPPREAEKITRDRVRVVLRRVGVDVLDAPREQGAAGRAERVVAAIPGDGGALGDGVRLPVGDAEETIEIVVDPGLAEIIGHRLPGEDPDVVQLKRPADGAGELAKGAPR